MLTPLNDTTPAIAVLNAGSSSLKLSLYAVQPQGLDLALHVLLEALASAPRLIAHHADGSLVARQEWPAGATLSHDQALHALMDFVRVQYPHLHLIGLGHRVVHGGMGFTGPVRITPEVLGQLAELTPLAPLHQPHNLAPIRLAMEIAPQLPQVACFDTSFHRSQPELAQMFALPHEMHQAGLRRYGFHGLSYEYIASRLPEVAPALAGGKVVVLHLGNGVSACALQAGRSVASSMGFTAVEGLPMGTRSGSVDPGLLLYLMDQRHMQPRALEHLLYQESGLLGVSGLSSDMRALLASDSPRAALAVDLFVYRIQREVGSLAAALGGLDGLVFTAGIGEHAAEIRRRVLAGLGWLGLSINAALNDAASATPCCISTPGNPASAWVIPTDEELMIARHTHELLSPA